MGKETDLLDDSALVSAFDQAMTKYKVMHRGAYHENHSEEEKVTCDRNENESSVTEEIVGHEEPHDNSNEVGMTSTQTSMPSNSGTVDEALPLRENHMGVESCSAESNPQLPGVPSTDEIKHDDLQGEEYSQLLSQYYELEEKRQNVLQQFHQAGYWNNQYPAQYSASQAHQGPGYNAANTGFLASGCGFFCPWDPYCSTSQTHQAPEGMAATERAISSLKLDDSAALKKCEEEETGKEETPGLHESQRSQSISPETDLSLVLNAWYSAGFHTGRYLLEQSRKKGHN